MFIMKELSEGGSVVVEKGKQKRWRASEKVNDVSRQKYFRLASECANSLVKKKK